MQQPLYLPDLNITSQIRNKTGVSGSCLAMHVFINYVFTYHGFVDEDAMMWCKRILDNLYGNHLMHHLN